MQASRGDLLSLHHGRKAPGFEDKSGPISVQIALGVGAGKKNPMQDLDAQEATHPSQEKKPMNSHSELSGLDPASRASLKREKTRLLPRLGNEATE